MKNNKEDNISRLSSIFPNRKNYKNGNEISSSSFDVIISQPRVSNAEHCFKVKEARKIFENFGQIPNNHKSVSHKSVDDTDRGTGSITQNCPSIIDNVGEEAETTDKCLRTRTSVSNNETTTTMIKSLSKEQNYPTKVNINRKKSQKKVPSWVDHKGSEKCRNLITEADIERENDGVIIRMKNQEEYYDGRAKYRSLLPDAPFGKVFEKNRVLLPILRHNCEENVDECEELLGNSGDLIESSRLTSSITCDGEYDKDGEEYGDWDELEPSGELDSSVDMKVSDLMWLGPQRIKWTETEEGQKLIQIKELNIDLIKWQEAQFEVITSEASYNRSLEVLVNKIYKSPMMVCHRERRQQLPQDNTAVDLNDYSVFQPIMTALQKHHLFSNVLEIHICSGELLRTLEARWRENPFIEDLSDIIVSFSKEKLRPYVTYLRNQRYQTATYNHLLTNPDFANVIRTIENDSDCCKMNLSSFLLLPMQRLLRLKLLFTVIRHYIPPGYPTQGCDSALASLEALIKECSDQKMLMEQKEEILMIYSRLTFRGQTGVSIGNKPLLKSGELRMRSCANRAPRLLNSSFVKWNNNKSNLYLFEDQLIIAKKRSFSRFPLCLSSNEEREIVTDIGPRSDVTFEACPSIKSLFSASNYNFKLTLAKGLQGHAEYLCEADSKEDFDEWQTVFSSYIGDSAHFEFNEVLVSKDYKSVSSKELDLMRGQILTITKRISNDRAIATSGNQQGEIPLTHVQFVMSPQHNHDLIKEIRVSFSKSKHQ